MDLLLLTMLAEEKMDCDDWLDIWLKVVTSANGKFFKTIKNPCKEQRREFSDLKTITTFCNKQNVNLTVV